MADRHFKGWEEKHKMSDLDVRKAVEALLYEVFIQGSGLAWSLY